MQKEDLSRNAQKIIVVGAGPGGVAAAVQCTRLGVAPLLLEKTGVAGGLVASGFSIDNYPGLEGPVKGRIFARRLGEHLKRFSVPLVKQKVVKIFKQNDHWLVQTNKQNYLSQNVIVATGTTPKLLHLVNEEKLIEEHHLFYSINALLKSVDLNNKTILVIGAGEAAFDYSLSLAAAGAHVKVLIRGDKEKAMGQLANTVKQNAKIQLIFKRSLKNVKKTTKELIAEIASDKDTSDKKVLELLHCNAVISAIGRTGNLKNLIEDFEKYKSYSLALAPGLFICGDAKRGSPGQTAMAAGDGLLAAEKAVERTLAIKANKSDFKNS